MIKTHLSSRMSLKEPAAERHQEMAPSTGLSNGIPWLSRPDKRIEFCQSIVAQANEIATALVGNEDWRRIFNDTEDSHVRQFFQEDLSFPLMDLQEAASNVMGDLAKFPTKTRNDPLLVFVPQVYCTK